MNSTYTIRPAGASDDAAVVELLVDTFCHLYESLGLEMSAERRTYLGDQAARRSFAFPLICEADGKMAGTVTLVPPSEQCKAWIDSAWEIRLLAVHPAMQGRGIARALLHAAERRAALAGAKSICLHARRGIRAQEKFYPAAGYVRDAAGDLNTQPFQEGYRKVITG